MTTEDAATCFNAIPRCSNSSSTSACQQLSPSPSPPMSPAHSVMSESSMSSVNNDRSDSEDDGDEEHRSRLQVTFMRPGCIEEHIIKSRTLAAAKLAAAAAAAAGAGSTPMEH
ncbi:hypothetical protein EC957_007433 [Mortierella hygrophila]|uniref:Uncharacterized protein n=1 Tax=Mortierella hygrophila TaxID=979708 RepID=A0A9P6EXZ3_9FUNG|nr:hypothetical protein EC957_007433 [Mortierella hygrophila]